MQNLSPETPQLPLMAVALNFQTGHEAVITFCLFNMGKMNDFFHPQKNDIYSKLCQLTVAIDFNIMEEKILWKSIATTFLVNKFIFWMNYDFNECMTISTDN